MRISQTTLPGCLHTLRRTVVGPCKMKVYPLLTWREVVTAPQPPFEYIAEPQFLPLARMAGVASSCSMYTRYFLVAELRCTPHTVSAVACSTLIYGGLRPGPVLIGDRAFSWGPSRDTTSKRCVLQEVA